MSVSSGNKRKRISFIAVIGALFLGVGLVGMYSPEILKQFLLPSSVTFISEQALALIVIGVVLHIVGAVLNKKDVVREGMQGVESLSGNAHAASAGYQTVSNTRSSRAGLTEEDVDWSPLKPGGANFKTHHLVEVNSYRLEVCATVQMKIFCWVFILIGAGVGSLISYSIWNDGGGYTALFPVAFGLVFIFVGGAMLRSAKKSIIFDKGVGWFWKGAKQAPIGGDFSGEEDAVLLSKVQALQLLSERCVSNNKSGKRSYYSYELNMVLNGGERINVMDHGNQAALTGDAQRIARLLDVPVWERA